MTKTLTKRLLKLEKTNANKLSLDFFANCCVRCCDVTYKMIRVEEKKENHMVDINRKQF
jgi:hypothetical protein